MRDQAQSDAALSFVPSIVRKELHGGGAPFDAAVLFIDAVGFTAKASALVDAGPDGVERVSSMLDGHYATLLSLVERHGGEAIRFVGDALLALFPAHDRSPRQAARDAVACANDVQHAGGLPVRAAVTAGTVQLAFVGRTVRHFVLTGAPLERLGAFLSRAKPGTVVTDDALDTLSDVASSEGERAEAPFSAVRAFVPASVLGRIDTGHLDWLAELRPVSAVFLVAPRADDAALEEARAIVEQHSAFLKEFVVDDKGWTLVAATGVPPFAEPDDPLRAVRLARALARAFAARGLTAGVGVASGRAFCGAVGTASRREYAIVGAVMNLASRLAGAAASGQAICDEETARFVRSGVATERLAPLTLKGFAQPVSVFAIGEDRERDRAPIAGRAEERARIVDAIAAQKGAILFEGEPGIGKSHLLDEAIREARARGLSVLSAAGDPAQRAAAYHPWRAPFASLLAAHGSVVALLREEDQSFAPLLSAVLPSAPADNDTTRALGGQQRADRTRELLVEVLAASASRRPALLVFEDLHAVDPPSLELLRAVLARAPQGLVAIASSRPAAEPIELAAQKFALAPLGREATSELLSWRLGARDVGSLLVDHVHARAAGNPLFIDQLALSLVESRAVVVEGDRCRLAAGVDLASIELPATVQGAINARLDRLSPPVQLTLKVASAVGQTFSQRLVTEVHPHDDDQPKVSSHLDLLEHAQLVLRDAALHQFRHDLVREVAYGLMLFAQRRSLHREIARWYEREHAADLTPHLALLAHHHRNAGETALAVDYLEREAIRAFSIGLARQSVAVGVDAASLLGVELPRSADEAGPRIGALVGATMGAIAGRKPAELLALPPLTKPEIGRTIKLLLELAPFTFQAGRPELYAVIGLTCLALTLEHGSSAPDVYSTYSVVHRAIHRDAAGAYEWSQLALDYDAKTGGSALARVAFVHGWFHNHWVRPLETSIHDSLQAAERGLAIGDVLFGCYNLSGHVVYLAAAGKPLDLVIDRARAHHARNGGRVVNAAFHCLHEMQVAKALAGKTQSPLSLTDAEFDEGRDVASICATDYYNQIGYYLVSRVKLHSLFGDARGALDWAGKIGPLVQAIDGQVAYIDLVVHRTLAELDLGLVDAARTGVAEAEVWARGCPANFLAIHELLAAALAHAERDDERAKQGFARAVDAARANGQLHWQAIAEERASRIAGNESRRAAAVSAYRAWGAHAKAASLAAN